MYSAERMRAILVGVRNSVQRHLAGHHVDLIADGERDQDVGLGDARGLEHRGLRGVADHGAHVEPVLQIAQHVLVDVDDRDVVGLLAREVVRRGAPDLSGAQDEDFHGRR